MENKTVCEIWCYGNSYVVSFIGVMCYLCPEFTLKMEAVGSSLMSIPTYQTLHGRSSQANYTNGATATCRWS
jgi:hypothetical protein